MNVIVFDFDGTIADTLETIIKIINDLSEKFGYEATSSEELRRLRNLSSQAIIKESGISPIQLPCLVREVRKRLNGEIAFVPPIPGIPEALAQLKQRDYRLGILTSNSQDNVWEFLRANRLESLFDFVDSSTSILGKSRTIARMLRRRNLSRDRVVYVGDETRDIEAARAQNLRAIAVSWGFNSPQALELAQPDVLIHTSDRLLEVVESLQQRASA
jgi:phosphoglycolate phosphatase